MDSKQLFRLFNTKYRLADWLDEDGRIANSDGKVKWHYCGSNNDFRADDAEQIINETFSDDQIYICISSGKSYLTPKSSVMDEITKNLHKKEIGLIDQSCSKLIFFNTYATFKIGIVQNHPKERDKIPNTPLEVRFHANIMNQDTEKVASVIRETLKNLSKQLSIDYDGIMEHLWIDMELLNNAKPHAFRFQKRVSIDSFGSKSYYYNVGHYSVKPDFEILLSLSSDEDISKYILQLLYNSTEILIKKQKRLGNFNAIAFRADFLSICHDLGYLL